MSKFYNLDLLLVAPLAMLLVLGLRRFLNLPRRLPRWNRWLSWLWVPAVVVFAATALFRYRNKELDDAYLLLVLLVLAATLWRLWRYRPAGLVLLGLAPLLAHKLFALSLHLGGYHLLAPYSTWFGAWVKLSRVWLIAMLLLARSQKRSLHREQQQRKKEAAARRLAAAQNAHLERLVTERTATLTQQAEALREALAELRTTQTQLIQREKMASLGELTAGIAHEIQNPLNFVNNFAEVSAELVAELVEEQARPDHDETLENELLDDLKQNLLKINQHGQRAAGIVRGMLAHSRVSTGQRAPTDVNALCDEYLRLAYHGLRAKDKRFNATLAPELAPDLPLVPAVAGDLGRVLLNLFTNAFYAVQQRQQQGAAGAGYAPTVGVRTGRVGAGVEVRVRDNGAGIAAGLREKIFQPFFTTKPAGEGTGLGLSLAHDIVVQGHGGTLRVESQEGQGTEFVLTLPA